jgi:hypothetical protein
MVNSKRIEQKLPLLAADGPCIGFDYEEKEWWIRKLKRNEPEKYVSHLHNIINDVEALERDAMALRKKKMMNGNKH